jgi:hypothetical protein
MRSFSAEAKLKAHKSKAKEKQYYDDTFISDIDIPHEHSGRIAVSAGSGFSANDSHSKEEPHFSGITTFDPDSNNILKRLLLNYDKYGSNSSSLYVNNSLNHSEKRSDSLNIASNTFSSLSKAYKSPNAPKSSAKPSFKRVRPTSDRKRSEKLPGSSSLILLFL